MNGQLTIFDMIYPNRIDPLHEVIKRARPYWTTSRDDIKKYHDDLTLGKIDMKGFATSVKYEYCPYGFAGAYGMNGEPNTLIGYDMITRDIRAEYKDEHGERQTRIYSWEDFARELDYMIRMGEI